MSKYNQVKVTPTVTNHQGGTSFQLRPELELVGILATGLDNKFYEKESDREKRIFELVEQVAKKDPVLLAKMLVYARSVMGQRSVTHVAAVAALKVLSGNQVAAKLFTKRVRNKNKGGLIYRIDDMFEILAYYFMRNPAKLDINGKRIPNLPNSIKKGFKSVLENADEYELAKYQGNGKSISLVDIVNLVRPKPSEKMQETFKKLMKGELKQFNTAEDKQTKSGQEVAAKVKSGELTKTQATVELKEAKAENWKELIENDSIGYLALLRNLRNITKDASDSVFNAALNTLTNSERIRKSLVFPHQIDLAFEILLAEGNSFGNRMATLLLAVNKAYELAIPNLTTLFSHGRTAVVVDTSGSMTSNYVTIGTSRTNKRPVDKAALIGATLAKGTNADMYTFDTSCRKYSFNPLDTVNTIKKGITDHANGGGTYFDRIFASLNGKYDRIFILSDEQGADSMGRGSEYASYISKNGRPFIYSVNLCGYGTTMFKESDKIIRLFGYSKDIYEQIKVAEIDPTSILKEIQKIEL